MGICGPENERYLSTCNTAKRVPIILILGLLSIIQIAYLPGALVIKAFRLNGKLQHILLSFAMSGLVNFQMVYVLTLLGWYTRPVVLSIFLVELMLFIFLYHHSLSEFRAIDKNAFEEMSGSSAIKYGVALFAFLMFLHLLMILFQKNPGVFGVWDDIISWNRWAVDWYHGTLPTLTWHYPQLLPANWSLTYMFIGNANIHFFAKAYMGLFPVALLLVSLDLSIRFRSIAFLGGLGTIYFLLTRFIGKYLGEGYADIPVAFFAWITFYLLLLGLHKHISAAHSLLLSSLMIAAASLTKQSGMFTIILLIGIGWRLIKNSSSFQYSNLFPKILLLLLLISILVAPWYIAKEINIAQGQDYSEIRAIISASHLFHGKGYIERLQDATQKFITTLTGSPNIAASIGVGIVFLVCMGASLTTCYGKYALFLIAIPYYILWACFYSYDARNLALAYPFLGFSFAVGLMILSERISVFFHHRFSRKSRKKLLFFIAISLLITGIGIMQTRYNDQRFFAKQDRLIRSIGNIKLNASLYAYKSSHEITGQILTRYQILKHLPELRQYYWYCQMNNFDAFMKILHEHQQSIRYLLLYKTMDDRIHKYVNEQSEKGRFREEFRDEEKGKYVFYEIMYQNQNGGQR